MKVPLPIRFAIQTAGDSETNSELARKFELDKSTVARWRSRSTFLDESSAPHRHGRRKLTDGNILLIRLVRMLGELPLDELLAAVLPHLAGPVSRQQIHNILRQDRGPRFAGGRRKPAIPAPAGTISLHLHHILGGAAQATVLCARDAGDGSFFLRALPEREKNGITHFVTAAQAALARPCHRLVLGPKGAFNGEHLRQLADLQLPFSWNHRALSARPPAYPAQIKLYLDHNAEPAPYVLVDLVPEIRPGFCYLRSAKGPLPVVGQRRPPRPPSAVPAEAAPLV